MRISIAAWILLAAGMAMTARGIYLHTAPVKSAKPSPNPFQRFV